MVVVGGLRDAHLRAAKKNNVEPATPFFASHNAYRHGLSLPVTADPARAKEVERLARKLAGADSPST